MRNSLGISLLCALLLAAFTPVETTAADDAGGFYISASGLYVVPTKSDLSDVDYSSVLSMKSSFGLAAAAGYEVSPNLSAEVEVGYRKLDYDKVTRVVSDGKRAPDQQIPGDLTTFSALLNGYYVFDEMAGVEPYVGGGVGFARHSSNVPSDDASDDSKDNDTVFSYQAMAGIVYGLSENLDIRLGYRYFGTADAEIDETKMTYGTHNVEVGFVHRF